MAVNDYYVCRVQDGIYGGRFAPPPDQLDLVVAGDSLTADSYPSAGFRWGLPLSRSPLKLVYNAGVASDTLDMLWARWQTTVLDKLPSGGVVFLRIGTNSIGNADFNSKYQRFIDTVLARNDLKMVMFALPPKNSSGAQILIHNAFIAGAVSQDPSKLFYIQDSTALGDASYNYIQAYYTDTIHMNSLGQYTQGLSQQGQIAAIFGESNIALVMSNDNYSINAASNQFVKNPLNTNSAEFWTAPTTGAGTSAAGSVVAADVGDENQTPWYRTTIASFGGNGHTASIRTTLAHPAITSGTFARVRLTAELWFDDFDTASLSQITAYAQSGSSIFITGWRMGLDNIGVLQHKVIIDQDLAIDQTKTYTANTIPLIFQINAKLAGSGIGKFAVRNASVRVS